MLGVATDLIEGTIEEAVLKRSFSSMDVYDPIILRRDDGIVENLGKRIVHHDLSGVIAPGTRGRFYLYSTFEHQGIHGFRDTLGTAAFAFARNNEFASIGCILLGAAWLAFDLLREGGSSLWGPVLLIIGLGGVIAYRSARKEAERQFDRDPVNT